ncbi:MAG: sulfurtransferase [Geminicoccaceae bacterium]
MDTLVTTSWLSHHLDDPDLVMLVWVGFNRAAIHDGGLKAWNGEGRPLSTEPAAQFVKTLTLALRPELIADRDEVLAAIDDSAVHLIDTLQDAFYKDEQDTYGRPGHIPGASNVCAIDCSTNRADSAPLRSWPTGSTAITAPGPSCIVAAGSWRHPMRSS